VFHSHCRAISSNRLYGQCEECQAQNGNNQLGHIPRRTNGRRALHPPQWALFLACILDQLGRAACRLREVNGVWLDILIVVSFGDD